MAIFQKSAAVFAGCDFNCNKLAPTTPTLPVKEVPRMTSRSENRMRTKVGYALEVLSNSLTPFVIAKLEETSANGKYILARSDFVRLRGRDVQFVLQTMRRAWSEVFAAGFPWNERDRVRNLIHESLDIRNRWAHQRPFDLGEAFRALDTMERLVLAIEDKSAAERIRLGKQELLPSQPMSPAAPQDAVQPDPIRPNKPADPKSVTGRPSHRVLRKPRSTDRPQPIIQNLMHTLLEDYPTLLDHADIESLLDATYCKNALGLRISGFSLLRTCEQGSIESGHSRYYAREYAGKYLLCSQWWRDHHCHNAEVLAVFVQELIDRNPQHPGVATLAARKDELVNYIFENGR